MHRLKNRENKPACACRTPALALSGLLLVAPLIGTGCESSGELPQSAKADVTCSRSEAKAKVGWVDVSVKASCSGNEVDHVDVRMPCGSKRFQERCTLSLPVPGEASLVRGRDSAPIVIVVTDKGDGASVEISRKTMKKI